MTTIDKTAKKNKPTEASDEQHQEVIDLLKGRCLEVSFTIHGLPKSRRIKGKQAEEIAQAVHGKTRGVRSSWGLFTSEHPAVSQLNQAVRELEQLRDSWTIVRSADIQKTADKLVIEGGVRLLWDQDVSDFYKLFVTSARAIDAAAELVQKHLDQPMTIEKNGKLVDFPPIKDMDRDNAGKTWDESAYPDDVRLVVGVAKERDSHGMPILDEDDNPKYVISFDEYHVSEKLPEMLRNRAIERLDARLSQTVETAFSYAVAELSDSLTTFMSELVNRVRIYPKNHPFEKYCAVEAAEVVKVVDHDKDASVPPNHIRLFLAYKSVPDGGDPKNPKVFREWVGPISLAEYQTKVRPQSTGEKKKLSPQVIEGIISKMQSFRDKKSKMLGVYGKQALEDFDDLMKELTKFKSFHTSNSEAAQKLATKLRSSAEAKEEMAQVVADTVAALEDRIETVKKVVRRRKINVKNIDEV
jgi:hypothetical protein